MDTYSRQFFEKVSLFSIQGPSKVKAQEGHGSELNQLPPINMSVEGSTLGVHIQKEGFSADSDLLHAQNNIKHNSNPPATW